MRIKVCGITGVEQAEALQKAGADWIGLIFYEGSKRFAGEKLALRSEAIKSLGVERVGVFVNAPEEVIRQTISAYGLTAIQLHGEESPQSCARFQGEVTVIKAFQVSDETGIDAMVAPYSGSCDYYLFDTASAQYGGSGKRFNWAVLQKAVVGKPFFLSGGIGPDDVLALRNFSHPFLYALDVNSRFETAPGVKDLGKAAAFINQIKREHD